MSTYVVSQDGDSTDYKQDATTNFSIQNTAINNMTIVGTLSNKVMVSNIVRETTQKTLANTDSPYTLTANEDVVFCDTTSGNIIINLPAVSSARKYILTFIKTSASNTLTLDGNASENINGATTLDIAGIRDAVRIVHNGTEWFII